MAAIIKLISIFLQGGFFLAKLWAEKNSEKAKEIKKEMVDYVDAVEKSDDTASFRAMSRLKRLRG